MPLLIYLSGVLVFILLMYLSNRYLNENISIGAALVLSVLSWVAVAFLIGLLALAYVVAVMQWLMEHTSLIDWYDYLDNKFKGN